jgi:hypothetical protein
MNLQENIHRIKEVMGINEQIPDSRFAPRSSEDRLSKNNLSVLSYDDLVDVISASIDVVPGIGNLVSLGIDLIHSLSYLIRFYFSNSDEEKINNGVLGLITLGGTFVPVGGNSLPIVARQGVKQILRKTPEEILLIAKKHGLYNKTVILLSKQRWKYSLLLLLVKILGSEAIEYVNVVMNKLKELYSNLSNNKYFKDIATVILYTINVLEELSEHLDTAIQLLKTKEII